MKKSMIVVTGGAGFIGSCLLAGLNARGEKNIVVVDSLGTSEKWKNLVGKQFIDYFDKNVFLQFIQKDCLPFDCKAVFHLGACSKTTELDADYLIQNNTHYTKALAKYCLNHNLPFFYASSAATYGDGEQGFSDKGDLSLLRPKNVYGFSKHLFDLWARDQGVLSSITGFKFFNVFGPNEAHKTGMTSGVYNAYHQIKKTAKMSLFRSDKSEYLDGEQKRDFVYVKDVVSVLIWCLDNPDKKGIYNLGYGQATSWNHLSKSVFQAMGVPVKIEYVDMPEMLKNKYQYYTCADMSKLRSVCAVPFMSFEESVKDYVVHHLEKGMGW